MHADIELVDSVDKPTGEICVVYFSSISNNTHRFVLKLDMGKVYRIPFKRGDEDLLMEEDYVLICPTYGGGGKSTAGAVPKPVIKFLNKEQNRSHCKGVMASGNTNFGDSFCIAGPILSKKLGVPLLYQFELLGTAEDVKNVREILTSFWEPGV